MGPMGGDLEEIDHFTIEKCVLRWWFFHSLLEKWSLVNFQIVNERKRKFRAAEIRFYLHKDCCAAGIRFHLHKDFLVAVIEFSLHKEFHKKNHENQWYIQKFSALRAPICKGIQRKYIRKMTGNKWYFMITWGRCDVKWRFSKGERGFAGEQKFLTYGMITWCHDVMMTWCHDVMMSWWHDDMMTWWHDDMIESHHASGYILHSIRSLI